MRTPLGRRARHLIGIVVGPALVGPALLLGPPSSAAAPDAGQVYVVQGVAGTTWDIAVDGEGVASDVDGKEVVGPFDLAAGAHELRAARGDATVEAEFDVAAGESVDVVIHLPVDASKDPVVTSFANDLAPVADGKTRLSIAHTAAVGPADIKVDGDVLFADVASGEELTVAVPADTYRVAVVPAATDDPPVLGPVDLPLRAATYTRVFAIGVAARGTMDAVVHELPVSVKGSDTAPGGIPGGRGGQHASESRSTGPALAVAGVLALVGALLVGGPRRRTPGRSSPA
ncbi:hypothetical protein GCM10009623_27890 [Nocardioides aestuarii]|uniref:DUF4397 domain-containing protein n=1 Tax=Nocardioides aestuarii TaxID=252231 RepID=A0ABW4TQD2_9ACTN